jgi:REP element-mobilizing transposase RayT
MPRREVPLCAGEHYHFYNRGNNRGHIFFEQENYLFFLRRLRKHILPVLDVVAYCLMPTHYHLLVCVKETQTSEVSKTSEVSEVSRAMMRFSVSFTKAMNKRYDRVGSLFQGAFQAKHVGTDDYLLHLSRYVHLNPVLAGLVGRAEGWAFSSYRDYLGLRAGTLPRPEVVLAQFESPQAYRAFVEAYAPSDREIIADLLFD